MGVWVATVEVPTIKDVVASLPKIRIKRVVVSWWKKTTYIIKEIESATSKPTVGSESSSNTSLSQLNDSNDDLFDEYIDRDVIDEELRSWTHHSSLHGDACFLEEELPSGKELESSSISHLRSLGIDSDSIARIQDSDYPEFNEPVDVKRTIRLSVGMRFSNLYSLGRCYGFIIYRKV